MYRRKRSAAFKKVLVHMLIILLLSCMLVSSEVPHRNNNTVAAEAASVTARSSSAADSASAAEDREQSKLGVYDYDALGGYYLDALAKWEADGVPEATSIIRIPGVSVTATSEAADARGGSYQGKSDVLIWRNYASHWIEYKVEVEEAGLYEMALTYHAYTDPSQETSQYYPTVLAVSIDGHYPYREARAVPFPRYFADEFPLKKDRYGDHIRPQPIEIERWAELPFRDSSNAVSLPLLWKFSEGEYTIRLQGSESIVIDELTLRPPTRVPAYAEAIEQYPQRTASTGKVHIVEAEQADEKTSVSLQMSSDQSAFMSPKASGDIIFNSIGGNNWSKGGEKLTWKFEVPESGRYKIALRALNSWYSNKAAFRTIYIDGEVPFQPFLAYRFPQSNDWQGIVLGDERNRPYEIYLEQGEHTIAMEVTQAPMAAISQLLDGSIRALGKVSRDLTALTGGLTGNKVDMNRTWNITGDFPEIPQQLQQIRAELLTMHEMLLEANGRKDGDTQTLLTSVKDIDDMLDYPNDIPYHIESLSIVMNKMGLLRTNLLRNPLRLDRLYIAPIDVPFPRMESSFWEDSKEKVANFGRSFTKKDKLSENEEDVLNVWMSFGRDYVNLLQEMADQVFTPATGIPVKIDLLPREDLIVLANAAGKSPDVAIGISEGRPINFAFRDAAEDLSAYPGFDKLKEKFPPGALQPYYYEGGIYAMPETLQFKMMFYRKDILDQLGLQVPDTWEDVYEMLPVLQQKGYNFFIPPDFLAFFYQHGAKFYTDDGMQTALDSPEAFQAFKMMTELYGIYGIDKQVQSFFQHFRDGTMPIGFSDFNEYLQLKIAAPELTGWWDMVPIPGMKNEEGVTERWAGSNLGMLSQTLGGFGGGVQSGGGVQTSAMLFKKSVNKDWGWKFVEWWLSAQTQQDFGSRLEGYYGVQFRWNTANIDAFTKLPWEVNELQAILQQLQWYKSIINIPGSYFIPRELNNAWNRTVIDGMNYRSSLEGAVVNINRELMRKQQEFGYRDKLGHVVKTFEFPVIDKPWEGVQRYVIDGYAP
ncbi:extracellular solute-binding protein [Paenibacillus sp. J5C_2022]|uniref:extracellular solute-binding protein n=1 Tax=Paenibacillus sp. J5C2022 TaxID=2977129 RepID=UPI0021D175AA|nr:extracellular solute-binding protein [Paenibacillus sp. J5C2022]MCU6710208.1 extracellular solute-binding protein [Paenibacillus sp. J5C2022]